MFTCITCTKTVEDEGEEGGRGSGSGSATPSTKEALKSLTTQIKDMALKFSSKQPSKASSSTSTELGGYRRGQRAYPELDGVGYPYYGGGSCSSTPAWDFTRESSGDQSPRADAVLQHEDEPKEWMAQVEPGVHITFVSLPNGGNDLKRIRFSRDMFNKWQAQQWWGENYDRIMELYNVQRFNRQSVNTPPRSEDEPHRDSCYSRLGSVRESPMAPSFTPRNYYKPSGSKGYFPSDTMGSTSSGYGMRGPNFDAPRTTTSSRDEACVSGSNPSDLESEWVEEDEPGVYITIRQLADGTRELRRVRFSREKFGEVDAKTWWEENRERIQTQYL